MIQRRRVFLPGALLLLLGLSFAAPSRAQYGPPLPPPPTFRFTASNYVVSEAGGAVTLTVIFSGRTNQDLVSVDYATSNGSATAGADYTATSGTLTFGPGEKVKSFSVPILDDALTEGNETFTATLSNPVGGALADPSVATVAIVDDESPPVTVQFSADAYAVVENDGAATITVTLSDTSAQQVTVAYATSDGTAVAPDDYQSTSGTLTFAPGELTKTFSVPIVDDGLTEETETVNLTLSNPTNATLGSPSSATLAIIDNDFPVTVQFAMTDFSVSEGASATITATLNVWTDHQVTVAYATSDGTATAGDDYDSASGTLTFPAGTMSRTFAVNTKVDDKVEGSETVKLTLSNPSGATLGEPATATLTILDRGGPVLSVTATPSAICAGAIKDSLHQSTITATLTDGTDPYVGATVGFTTTRGTLSAGSAVTDANGHAEVTLTSDNKASESPDKCIGTVTAKAGPASASCDVEFQPADVALTATPSSVLIGEKAGFTASLSWNGRPVAQHGLAWSISRIWDKDGKLVYDGTGSPPSGYGSILAGASGQTDGSGTGMAVFQTGSLAGTVELKVADTSVIFMTSLKNPTAVAQVVISSAAGIRLQEVSFSGKNHALVSDFGAPFDAPQWTPYWSYPVAYTRNTKVTASAKILVNPAPAAGTKIKIKGVSGVTGVGGVAIEFPEREIQAPGGSIVTYAATDANVALLDKIQYIESFPITWTLSIDDQTQQGLLTSTNQFYVTWADPVDGPTIHTVIHLGCTTADGVEGEVGKQDDKVLGGIWTGGVGKFPGFTSKAIKRASNGQILTYYGRGPAGEDRNSQAKCSKWTTAAKLIESSNGTCDAWADLMHQALNGQGLKDINLPPGQPIRPRKISIGLSTKLEGIEWFAVKNWKRSTDPNEQAKAKIINEDAGIDGNNAATPDPTKNEAADAKGVPGQGRSPNPPSSFPSHTVIYADGKYWDPSYAIGPYPAAKPDSGSAKYEQDGLAGWIWQQVQLKTITKYLEPRPPAPDLILTYRAIGP